jgi:uncharacterized repeat protein (TIGR01451 family)
VADVLFGHRAPGGRTIQTVYPGSYQHEISIFDFNMRPGPSVWARPDCPAGTPTAECPRGTNPGRTYRFYTGDAVIPFGFGLSFTTFTYKISASPASLSLTPLRALLRETYSTTGTHFPRLNDVPQAVGYQVTVTNTGNVDADDAVLGFLTPPNAGKDGMPIKTLFGFERVFFSLFSFFFRVFFGFFGLFFCVFLLLSCCFISCFLLFQRFFFFFGSSVVLCGHLGYRQRTAQQYEEQ